MEFSKMSQKLYVGNLPYNMTSEALEDLFSEAGLVSKARVVTDRDTGRSKGFGFVEMDNAKLGEDAIARFNDKNIGGRALKVSAAREAKPASSTGTMIEYR